MCLMRVYMRHPKKKNCTALAVNSSISASYGSSSMRTSINSSPRTAVNNSISASYVVV